jgi:predicted transcriptional regulator
MENEKSKSEYGIEDIQQYIQDNNIQQLWKNTNFSPIQQPMTNSPLYGYSLVSNFSIV